MRHSISLLIAVLTIVGCSSNPNIMNLQGSVKGLKKGTLFLQKIEDSVLTTVDSVVVDGNSEFSFSEKVESPEIYFLYVRPKDGTLQDDRIKFFGEAGTLKIQTNLKNFGSAAKVSGSKNDSLLKDYDKLKQRYVSKNLDLIEKRLKAKKFGDDSIVAQINKKKESLLSSRYFVTINFALNNKDFEVAPYLILNEAYNSQSKYLDTVYNSLSPKIKNSKYGKELEFFIKSTKETDTLL